MLEAILLRPRGNEALNCRLGSLNILKKRGQPSEVYKKKLPIRLEATVISEGRIEVGQGIYTIYTATTNLFEDASKYRVI